MDDATKQAFQEIHTQFERMNTRFDGMDRRFDAMDRRFEVVDQRFDAIDRRFDGMDQRFDGVDKRIDGVDHRIDGLEATVHKQGVLLEEMRSDIKGVAEGVAMCNERMDREFIKLHERLDERLQPVELATRALYRQRRKGGGA